MNPLSVVEMNLLSIEMTAAWLCWSAINAWLAARKGRPPVTWLLLSLILSPLVGALLLLLAPPLPRTTVG